MISSVDRLYMKFRCLEPYYEVGDLPALAASDFELSCQTATEICLRVDRPLNTYALFIFV